LAVVLSLLLPALPAAAQIRPVPVEAGSAPLASPAGLAPSSSFSPALTLSLSAPSLGPSLNPSAPVPAPALEANLAAAARPDALIPASPGQALPTSLAAAIPSRPAEAVAPAATPARITTNLPVAGTVDGAERAGKTIPDADLDALFDGSAPRSGSAAATPESGPSEPRRPLLSPKNLKRAKTAAAISIPLAVGAAVFGAVSPHVALLALHWLGQGAYWLANPFAFAFTLPQIYKMLSRRSASVSTSMMAVGLLATVVMAVNMAYDGKDLMLYRNLAQAAGFGVMLFLKRRFSNKTEGPLPSRRRALLETAGAVLVMGAILALAGPALAAALPAVGAMASLLVPFQVISGFGFTYLMYAQLTKMAREHTAGDSSPAMMWAYLGTKTIWLWSFATMMSLATGPAWIALSLGSLFVGVCWFAGQAALSHLLHSPWTFLPEKLSFAGRVVTRDTLADAVAFVALSALILALSAGGWLAFGAFLGIPAADGSRFLMYLLYTVQSLVACLATLRTLRMAASFDKK
jgi:hypothetical protein